MATWTGTAGNDSVNWINVRPNGSVNGNRFLGREGNDTIWGSNWMENQIEGGDGNDQLWGGSQSDILLGDNGADLLGGGGGNDNLNGGAGNDTLYGDNGSDQLRGGTGNDTYRIVLGDTGNDTINDDLGPAANTGQGGGTNDVIQIMDAPAADLQFYINGNDLLITDSVDMSDGSFDNGVTIQNFYLGGNNVIEKVYGSEGTSYWDLTQFLAA